MKFALNFISKSRPSDPGHPSYRPCRCLYGTSRSAFILVLIILVAPSIGCRNGTQGGRTSEGPLIITSDTILSGMALSLLPPGHGGVSAILPPDQCPGHYDMKLSDIRKVDEADLIILFRDLPFMKEAEDDVSRYILLDRRNRNWMAPDSYRLGLKILAGKLAGHYPELKREIADRCELTVREVTETAAALKREIDCAGIYGLPVLASSMQREPLEWMGLRVVGDYGRPESMSVREIFRISEEGRRQGAVMVVDNLQSGPDAGRGVAEALGVPHVVLSNFPSEKGYEATLGDNVAAVLAALEKK